jgi:hypothetical protein
VKWTLIVTVCALAACRDPGPQDGWITVELRGEGAARLLNGPAGATHCADDSSLVVTGRSDDWFVAIGSRVAWPVSGRLELQVAGTLEPGPSAAAAFRSLKDSVGPALVAHSGAVVLERDSLLRGSFEVTVEDVQGDTARLGGEFRDVAVDAVCPGR